MSDDLQTLRDEVLRMLAPHQDDQFDRGWNSALRRVLNKIEELKSSPQQNLAKKTLSVAKSLSKMSRKLK